MVRTTRDSAARKTADPEKATVPETVAVRPLATPIPVKGPATTLVSLCVAIQPGQTSVERGQAALWTVSAWTKNGNLPAATIRLVAVPASLSAQFSFGCGTQDGTASCDLGEVASESAPRETQAQVTVPATATTVTSVELQVTASTAHMPKDPVVSATIPVTAPPAPGGGGGTGPTPNTTTTPLGVGPLPFVDTPSATLSPGGNAGGLFPTITPSPGSSPGGTTGEQKASGRTVANTSALPQGAPIVGGQLIGLGVLALAFVLAVTRLSVRRRPATNGSSDATKEAKEKQGD